MRAALIEAGAAGAGETLAQIGIQTGRRQFGEEPDIAEAATAVAVAAGGAGAFMVISVGTNRSLSFTARVGGMLPLGSGRWRHDKEEGGE